MEYNVNMAKNKHQKPKKPTKQVACKMRLHETSRTF